MGHVELTGGDDGLTHRVALPLYDAGLREGCGVYLAACGRAVPVAPLTAAPGRACPLCFAARQPAARSRWRRSFWSP